MTDMLKGSQVLQKTYTYIENVTKESRKALMEDFSQNHKGIGINLAPDILRQTILDWFLRRDPMLKLVHEKTSQGKPGDVRMDFRGETKAVRFNDHLHAALPLNGQPPPSPSFLNHLIPRRRTQQ